MRSIPYLANCFFKIEILLLVLFIAGCTSMPRYRRDALPPPIKPGGNYVETGVASYYADDFHGKPTSSGEIFDMYAMTAAHKTLPLGSIVKVTNLTNNKSVTVKINDRGPFVKKRIIDLSYGAAQVVGMVGPGTAKVRVKVISWGKEK